MVNYNYIDTKYNKNAGEDAYDVALPLYNIPVFNIMDLPYDTYTVTVTIAKPSQWYSDQNEFYLDGVRVYDPIDMSQDAVNKDYYAEVRAAYEKDLEADVKVNTLRNYMLDTQTDPDAEDPVWTDNSLVMFTDTNGNIVTASEYESNGPKQELYMTRGQSIRFVLSDWFSDKPVDAKLYLGAKVPEGKTGMFKVNGTTYTINNTTDCYYDITNAIATIENSHDGLCIIEVDQTSNLISFTNLKCPGFPNFTLAGMDMDITLSGGNDMTVFSLLRQTVENQSETPSDEEETVDADAPSDEEETADTDAPSDEEETTDTDAPSDEDVPDNTMSNIWQVIDKIISILKYGGNKWFR